MGNIRVTDPYLYFKNGIPFIRQRSAGCCPPPIYLRIYRHRRRRNREPAKLPCSVLSMTLAYKRFAHFQRNLFNSISGRLVLVEDSKLLARMRLIFEFFWQFSQRKHNKLCLFFRSVYRIGCNWFVL